MANKTIMNNEENKPISNNRIADLADSHGWKYVKQLHDMGCEFWSEKEVNAYKMTFEHGFLDCASILENNLRDALTNVVKYVYPDNPYTCPEKTRVLTEEQIEDVINHVFH